VTKAISDVPDSAVVEQMPEIVGGESEILSQHEAAKLLQVSTRYLRDSGCPKLLLPSNGIHGRHLVRYIRVEVLAWAHNNRWRC
jgi:hypothetical protein